MVQILRLNRIGYPPISSDPDELALALEWRAHTIAKVAAGLGIMSAREADVAIRRHVSAAE